MEEKVRVHLFISGIVQGVLFRYYMQREANRVGVKGWVRNLSDGRVEAVCEGSKESINKIIEWAHKGSPYSHVENVDIKWEKYSGEFNSFSITY